jgi:hypothetical protein
MKQRPKPNQRTRPRSQAPRLSDVLFLSEQDDGFYDNPGYEGGYGVNASYGSSSGGGSGNGMWSRNGLFGAMGFAAIRDIWNILKRDTAKLGVQALSTVGSLFAGTVTMLIPMNSHLATSYVTKKFMYWEVKAIKAINQQFEKELAGFDTGWELIKPDLIGLGFFVAPYGVVGNMMAAGQAIDTAISITNVMTGGLVGYLIDRIVNLPEDMRDPGNLDYYVRSHLYRPFSYSSSNWKERGVLGNLFHLTHDELDAPHDGRRSYSHEMMFEEGVGGKTSINTGKLKTNLEKLKSVLGDTYQKDMQKFMEEVLSNSKDAEVAFVTKNTQSMLAPMFPAIKADLQTNAANLQLQPSDVTNWSSMLSQKKSQVLDTMLKRYQPLIGKDPSGNAAPEKFKQIMLSAMG